MTNELLVMSWGCVLALVHIFGAAHVKTQQYGAKWNMGARDEILPEPTPLVGRMMRAQANFFETFPIAVAAALIVAVAGLSNSATVVGAWLWLVARIAYLPLYALGVPVVRTLVFLASIVGIMLMLWPALLSAL